MSRQKLRKLLDEIDANISAQASTRELALQNAALRERLDAHFATQDANNRVPEVRSAEYIRASLMDDAIALEASFANTHPVAERLIREFINSLSRLGI
jgi:hypothetical protein